MHEPPDGQALAPAPEAEHDELEITNLRGADRERPHAVSSARQHSSRRRLVRLGGVLAALALVVAVLLYGIHGGALAGGNARIVPSPPPLPTPVLRYPDLHGLQCLRDDAWSPDSHSFAYAGNTSQGCGYGQYFPNVINIYRATDGAFVRQLAPDPAIFAALGQPVPPAVSPYATPAPNAPFLMYDYLLWSRDGSRFALVFALSTEKSQFTGIAVVTTTGRVERVVATQLFGAGYLIFDLAAGSAREAGTAPDASGQAVVISAPPALAYRWSAAGQLVSVDALTSTSAPTTSPPVGPIGNPNGDPRFTIWQPGVLQCHVVYGAVQQTTGVYFYNAFLTAWSPDGRYVAAFFATAGRLQPTDAPVPDHAALVQAQAADVPLLPLRDRAFGQALRSVGTPRDVCNTVNLVASVQVAYRSDGMALAVLDDQGDFAVYAANTGAELYPFRPLELLPNTHNGNASAMRWSPDGTALLLPDGSLLHVGRLNG
ncbi:MAG TPA: hypothetical protein VF116_17840 [Ktedonobacterales bacterium]